MANKPIICKSAAFASADSKILKYFNIMRQLHPVLQALVYEYHDGVKEAIHRFCQQQNSKSIDESSECIYSDRVPRPTVLGTGPGVYETRRWWIIESVSSNLERYSEVIAEECEILMSSSLPGGYQDIPVCASAQKDAWRLFYLMEEGVWNKTNCSKCPVLTSLLQHNLKGKLCECSFGYAYFSRLRPGTDIAPHFGPTNFKLRLQLPLLLPTQRSAIMMQSEQPSESEIFKGCFIQCGGAKREYFPGKALIFDDSFAHSVVNQSAYERVVLIVDVWHPQLSRSAISAITSYFNPIETRIDDGHFPILPRREGFQSDKYDYLVKALCIGDNNAGKSSFVLRFADNTFHGGYMSTIGVDFKIRVLNVKNTLVKVQIWDVAGPERFRTITASYFKGAHVIFTFVDTTDDESLSKYNSILYLS